MKPIRIPRIKGLTLLSINYDKDQGDEPKYMKLMNHIVTHYTNQGFSYLGYKVSLPELATLLNTQEATLQKSLVHTSNIFSSLLKGTTQEEISRSLAWCVEALISDAFVDKIRYRELAENLERNLLYASKKVNIPIAAQYIKTLELGTKQQATFMSLLNYLIPKTGTQINVFQVPTGPSGQAAAGYLTREEAMQLLEVPAQKALTESEHLTALQTTYNIDSTPEVRANGAEEKGPMATRIDRADSLNDYLIEDISAALYPDES